VNRGGKEKTFSVKIARRSDEQVLASGGGAGVESALGIEIANISPEIAERYKIDDTDGVIVMDVRRDGKGAKAGINPGDIIKEINHQPVKNIEDYNRIVGGVKDGDALYFYLRRANKGFMVVKIVK
jgi:serine protease Do